MRTVTAPARAAAHIFAKDALDKGYEPEALHEYTDADGNPLYWRIRAKHQVTGEKWIRPMRPIGENEYELKEPDFAAGKPLYRLRALSIALEDEPVFIVEGEWCVDHMHDVGVLATTCGSAAAVDKTDWTPLANKRVTIWPDNDPTGKSFAKEIAEKLAPLNCKVETIDIDGLDLSDKGDVVDWLAQHPHAGSIDIDQLPRSATMAGHASPTAKTDAEVSRLADLSQIEYDQSRVVSAEQLGIRVSTLDDEVTRVRKGQNTGQGQSVVLEAPEPWHEPVEGPELVTELVKLLRSYIVADSSALTAIAFWTLHAHLIEFASHSPRLNITAPEKGCAKTLVLDLLGHLAPKSIRTENVTTAIVFRLMNASQPTLLIDEYDTFLTYKEELRGALNSGWQVGGCAMRCEGDGNDVRTFNTFGAVALAGIGALPGTLHDRSITIQMKRATQTESAEIGHFDSRHTSEIDSLQRKIARWATDHGQNLESDPSMPADFYGRKADRWRPLFGIADEVGGHWPGALREASIVLESIESEETDGVMLLEDIRAILADGDWITSTNLADKLVSLEGRPWAEFGRQQKPISTNGIARRLKGFGIAPKQRNQGGVNHRGYGREQFQDAFERYLPRDSVSTSAIPLHPSGGKGSSHFATATPVDRVALQKSLQPTDDAGCSGVAVDDVPEVGEL